MDVERDYGAAPNTLGFETDLLELEGMKRHQEPIVILEDATERSYQYFVRGDMNNALVTGLGSFLPRMIDGTIQFDVVNTYLADEMTHARSALREQLGHHPTFHDYQQDPTIREISWKYVLTNARGILDILYRRGQTKGLDPVDAHNLVSETLVQTHEATTRYDPARSSYMTYLGTAVPHEFARVQKALRGMRERDYSVYLNMYAIAQSLYMIRFDGPGTQEEILVLAAMLSHRYDGRLSYPKDSEPTALVEYVHSYVHDTSEPREDRQTLLQWIKPHKNIQKAIQNRMEQILEVKNRANVQSFETPIQARYKDPDRGIRRGKLIDAVEQFPDETSMNKFGEFDAERWLSYLPEAIDKLTERQRQIIELVYGLGMHEEHNHIEIGRKLGVTSSNSSQTHIRALTNIKKHIYKAIMRETQQLRGRSIEG